MTPPSQNIACICGNTDCDIPFGLCHCGCGGRCDIAKKAHSKYKHIKGMPFRCIKRHPVFDGDAKLRALIVNASPFKIDGVYCRLVPLTRGHVAIVDADDYEWVNQWKWSVMWNPPTRSFYAKRSIRENGQTYSIGMHRVILGLTPGDKRNGDHINHVTLDNRRANLRIATRTENGFNKRMRSDNTSGFKGVHWKDEYSKWRARISVNKKRQHLGYFSTPEQAHAAYCEAAKKYHGEFAKVK